MTAITLSIIVAILLLGGSLLSEWIEQRREVKHKQWLEINGGGYAMDVCRYLFDDGDTPTPTGRIDTSAMLTLLHSVCTLSSGYSPRRVQSLIEQFGLDSYLRRQTLYGLRNRRSEYAMMLAQMGLDIDAHPPHPTSEAMLWALSVAQLNDERVVLNNVARSSFGLLPMSIILELRFQRFGAQEYKGALLSEEPQVVRFGLAAVRRFNNEQAIDEVRFLCDTRDDFLLFESLYTLFALHAPLTQNSVARALARLDSTARKRLYRHLVVEGYSSTSLEALCRIESSPALYDFALGLCDSYKCRLDTPTPTPVML